MTKREAAIVSAYTGIMLGEFGEMHKYVEELFERPVFTHEFAYDYVVDLIKEKSRNDFISLEVV